jgi:O-antigen/teichoic acid export membrane protein
MADLSTKPSFKRNAMWAVAGSFATVFSQVIAIVVLARLLSPYEFGVVTAATLVTQFALIFAEFGVGPYVVQRADLNENGIGTAYRISCFLGLLIAALVIVIAPLLADFLDAPELTLVLRVYSLMFLIFGWYAIYDALTQRALDYSYLARADAVSFSVGYAGVSIYCAFLGFSYWSLVMGHISQMVIRGIFLRLRHKNLSQYQMSMTDARSIMHFGFGQTLSRIASLIASQADGYIVATRLGITAIGTYGRANQLVMMPAAQLGQIFDKLIFPHISQVQSEHQRPATIYLNALTGICILSFPVCVLFWVCGENIVNILLGAKWHEVTQPLMVLALAIPFRLIHKVSDPTARAMGKTYSRAWRQWVVAISLVFLVLVLSPYGLVAIAWAVVVVSVIDAGLMVWLCYKATHFKISQLGQAFKPGLYSGFIALLAINGIMRVPVLKEQNDVIQLLIACLLFVTIVFFFLRKTLKKLNLS